MAEASSSKAQPATPSSSKAQAATPSTNVDDIDKLLAQEESAFQRDYEVSLSHGNAIGLTPLIAGVCL